MTHSLPDPHSFCSANLKIICLYECIILSAKILATHGRTMYCCVINKLLPYLASSPCVVSEAHLAAPYINIMMIYKHSKLGHTDLLFGLWSEFISRPRSRAVQITSLYVQWLWFVILVNTQTDRHTNRQLLTSYTISSANWAKMPSDSNAAGGERECWPERRCVSSFPQ